MTRCARSNLRPLLASFVVAIFLGLLTDCSVASAKPAAGSTKRPVSVADMISMSRLGSVVYTQGGSSLDEVATFSPNSRRFVVVLRKGNLERNTNEFSVLLWQTDAIALDPSPQVLFTMESSSNRPAVRDVTWLSDNETIEFIGENPGEEAQVYSFNVKTRVLHQVSKASNNVVGYSVTPDGRQMVFVVELPPRSVWTEETIRNGLHVRTEPLQRLLGAGGLDTAEKQMFFQIGEEKAHRLYTNDKIGSGFGSKYPHLSPNGHYVAILTNTDDLPEVWRGYSARDIQTIMSVKKLPGQETWPSRYELIDTRTGESRILLNVPYHSAHRDILWAPDSESVVLAGTYLPLVDISPETKQKRASKQFTAEVKVSTGEIIVISDEDLTLVAWNATTNQLICEPGLRDRRTSPIRRMRFRKTAQTWERVSISPVNMEPEIVLDEDLHTAPKIYAVDPKGQRTLLLDLNPQFSKLDFGHVEEISWQGPEGRVIKGGLYLPVGYEPGRRYPLVIQTHAWNPARFWIDGPWTTAYAAQALAGRGIMVLQAEKWDGDLQWLAQLMNTSRENETYLAAYEGAIEYLDRQGMIDLGRIGILGFSRTCMYVKYALTASKYHFAAASVTDGIDAGYFQYLVGSNSLPHLVAVYEMLNGGKPFGEGFHNWLERSPGFRIDKVHTPLLITALNPGSALSEWEWYSALSSLDRPVDMIVMQDGEHILQKPSERMISQQSTVDWFTFWLLREEGSDPSKTDQYSNWRRLRELQENGRSQPNP